jgi:excisionase family DNA binding protein
LANEMPSTQGLVADVPEVPPGSGEATYTTGQAARAFGVSSSRVRKMIASGELASHRDQQGRHQIPHDAVRAKLKEGEFAPSAGAASEGLGEAEGTEKGWKKGAWADALREEVEATRQELQQLEDEVRALRRELLPLVRLARSAEEDKRRILEKRDVLQEERARLLAEVEGERQRADELVGEMEAIRQTWWARWFESKSGKGRGD